MRTRISLCLQSVIIGWFFSQVSEVISFPFNPLYPGISLIKDILITSPIYICTHLFWFFILRRYKLNLFQALILGGMAVGIFEFTIGGGNANLLLVILFFPVTILIHGMHMAMPYIFLKPRLPETDTLNTIYKIPVSIIIPALGTGLGVIIAFLLVSILNIKP